jgi:hypothetical protein
LTYLFEELLDDASIAEVRRGGKKQGTLIEFPRSHVSLVEELRS